MLLLCDDASRNTVNRKPVIEIVPQNKYNQT